MSYIGINDNMEQASVFKQVGNFVREFGHPKVFVHVSSPCASGSPLRYLSGSQPTDADFEWFAMFPWVSKYLALGHYSSFELPWRNSIWKHHLTIETLRKTDMTITPCCTCVRQELRRRTDSRLVKFWGLPPIQSSLAVCDEFIKGLWPMHLCGFPCKHE